MVELPKTQEELDALLEEKVNAKVDELSKKHNEEMANLRIKHKKEFDDFKANQALSDDERAKKLAEEREKAVNDELTELRAYKKTAIIKDRLAKENLPTYLANDNRLLTAEDGDLDKAIKLVKTDYEASLPKGNTHSTVVPTSTSVPNAKDNKGISEFAQALENALK